MWLEVSTTNNDPAVVVKYYLDTVLKLGGTCASISPSLNICTPGFKRRLCYVFVIGCPTLLRSDYGTENTSIATCQMMFQHPHRDRYTQQLCVWKLHKEYCKFVVSLSGHILIEHDVYYKRIESWWSRLRNFKTEWWIQLFKVSNYIHVGVCMIYSYLMHRTWTRRACLTLQILCIGILPISISFLILLVLCHL